MHGVKLRVHIAPVGFENDRIVLPLRQMKADKVWLISQKHDNKAATYSEKIISLLKTSKIDYEQIDCEITDLYDVLKTIRIILEKEASNDIFINVSSGSKIEAIAGMMASMIFREGNRIMPYYVVPEKYNTQPEAGTPLSSGIKDIQTLPEYRIEQPKQQLIKLLRIVDQAGGAISKKELIEEATENGLIRVGGRNEAQSKYMSLNKNFLSPLEDWRLIRVQKEGRRKQVLLTDEGKNMLKFLG